MWAALWTWFKVKFAVKLGKLLKILLRNAVLTIAAEILDEENQKKAYQFVKELNLRTDLTNAQKAKVFNKQMLEWAKKAGKVFSTSVVNCLRELAVSAVKTEILAAKVHGSAAVVDDEDED